MNYDFIYYVYMYIDPESNQPFYVGKGKDRRKFAHLREAKNNLNPQQGQHKLNKIRKILREGKEPIISIVKDSLNKIESINLEIELIAKYGGVDLNTGILTNKTNGGEGKTDWTTEEKGWW